SRGCQPPSVRKSAVLRRLLARLPIRIAFFAHSGKAATWMSGCSILSPLMCWRWSGCPAYYGTRFRATGRSRMDGSIARLRNAVHKPGQSWCCMTFPLVLCATLKGSWIRQPSSASACARILRRSAFARPRHIGPGRYARMVVIGLKSPARLQGSRRQAPEEARDPEAHAIFVGGCDRRRANQHAKNQNELLDIPWPTHIGKPTLD